MYSTTDLATFTVREFRRGLDGLTAEEALVRHPKADGTSMNAVSWIVAHIAGHWAAAQAAALRRESELMNPARDGSPPPYADALVRLDAATSDLHWIAVAGDVRMARRVEDRDESAGSFLMRAILHTWFHTGEINAIRQLLGHPEIAFVAPFEGLLEWVPEETPRG
jgi:hypothetical protein